MPANEPHPTHDDDHDPGRQRERSRKRTLTAGTSTLEWIIAALSTLVVAATIAFLLSQAADEKEPVPLIEVRAESIVPYEQGYIVELTVYNSGRSTAAQLVIEGTLLHGDSAVQTSTATIDYLPARSLRRAALIFAHDPNRYQLLVRPTGFAYP